MDEIERTRDVGVCFRWAGLPGKTLLPVLAVAHGGHKDGADGDKDLS